MARMNGRDYGGGGGAAAGAEGDKETRQGGAMHSIFDAAFSYKYIQFLERFIEFVSWIDENAFDLRSLTALSMRACEQAGV